MEKEIIVNRYFSYDKESTQKVVNYPLQKCKCGKYPSYHASCGGFNFYGYYKCHDCNLFATGRHQFPNIGLENFGYNENNEPKLFVEYSGENNSEKGWNEFINKLSTE
jgi:hypothetical protein